MRSVLIEFHRFKDLKTGILRCGDDYLVAAATRPVQAFQMPLDHLEFLRLMRKLRYEAGLDARQAALKQMGDMVTSMLGAGGLPEPEAGDFPLQLDLVVNAAELAALPFEAALDREGRPLLARDDRPIELTRRIRHDFAAESTPWPAQPRILFAWACPPDAGVAVPHADHERALESALAPWMVQPDERGGALTVVREASLTALRQACEASARTTPFTHVHILAHGYPIGPRDEQRFGMALHGETGELDAVAPEKLIDALAPLCHLPVIVTLATCDAANEANTITPEKSIAHALHVSGFPVVVASQLPFTVPGSTLMVTRFYGALLSGTDVRTALHDARVALYERRDRTGHDWASLVGYVRLPEGYAEHLTAVRLETVLASLKTVQKRVDRLLQRADAPAAEFDHLASLLRERRERLEAFSKEALASGRPGVLEENYGLLGSAEKRLAELHFERGKRFPDADATAEIRQGLSRAAQWYRRGYERNLSDHWTGAQCLSLEAVLTGKIANPGHWWAAIAAAEIRRREPKEYWAHGSLVELYLLAPLAGQPTDMDKVIEIIQEMKRRVTDYGKGDRFPLESTERQLRRYVEWWTTLQGFFPGAPDRTAEARRLLEVLRA